MYCRLVVAVLVMAAAITGSRVFAAQPGQAFPALEPPFAGRLVGIDREWNLSFRAELSRGQ
jgi:hypothetical protein